MYRDHIYLKKAHYLLRPINVPFKNKWLRDRVSDLHIKDGLLVSNCDPNFMFDKVGKELQIDEKIIKLGKSIHSKTEIKISTQQKSLFI